MKRTYGFLGREIVSLPTRPIRAVKIVYCDSTVALLANGKIAWGRNVRRHFQFGRPGAQVGRELAEGMMKLGAIGRDVYDQYVKELDRAAAAQNAKDAADEFQSLADKIGLSLSRRQLRKIEVAKTS